MTKKADQAAEVRRYGVEYRKQAGRSMTGVVATYGRMYDLGYFTERLAPGCFAKSITEAARALPLHVNHDHVNGALPIGRAVDWQDSETDLRATWEFDTRAEAVEAARMAEAGILTGLSVGFNPIQSRWAYSEVPGVKDHVDRIECRMLETSMCSVPGYDDAAVLAVRSMGHPERPGTAIAPRPQLEAARAWLESLRRV